MLRSVGMFKEAYFIYFYVKCKYGQNFWISHKFFTYCNFEQGERKVLSKLEYQLLSIWIQVKEIEFSMGFKVTISFPDKYLALSRKKFNHRRKKNKRCTICWFLSTACSRRLRKYLELYASYRTLVFISRNSSCFSILLYFLC